MNSSCGPKLRRLSSPSVSRPSYAAETCSEEEWRIDNKLHLRRKYINAAGCLNTIYRVVFNELDAFTAPRFTATCPPPAAERMRILPVTQHADNIWNEGKFLPLFRNHRRC
jgi:hypothetical protein